MMSVWINGQDPLKIAAGFYASMHMIFFLRGDFTNGYAFFNGEFCSHIGYTKNLFYPL